MTSTNTYQITPFMHVKDLDETVRFFTEVLGFTVPYRQDNYAYLDREGAAIRILGHEHDDEVGEAHRGFAYYIDVRDLGVVLDQIGDKLAGLPEGHVVGPKDQAYGQRELMIRVPDGNVLVFGQAIKED
jgi:catechol 2,3-dioxygenase-like lactoylglutathione lyase family enzyme